MSYEGVNVRRRPRVPGEPESVPHRWPTHFADRIDLIADFSCEHGSPDSVSVQNDLKDAKGARPERGYGTVQFFLIRK